ncbi:MAG: molecular chaperone HtpG [Firmicutes bacterium]|nr:molecular chaperone HtpG [Bacillota bacterium]MDY5335477.1 molecular chaperone HtpG [Bacilli bacterium]
MKKRQFKTESKRILDLMINSIYTNKEIFLRELISNSSDALDKLYYLSLTNKDIKVNKDDLFIRVDYNKDKRTITISDNGTGMTEEELENNLGVIAESGSLKFKEENKEQNDVNIIGQFGVGFYSAFMVSDKVTVESKSYKDDKATIWESTGVDGYTLSPSDKKENGTIITLHLKEDTEDYNYSELLSEYKLRSIIKKYSDYISYPIKMEVENNRKKEDSDEYETYKEVITINSRIPLWKRNKKDITEEEYNNFYNDKFFDYNKPLDVLHFNIEGNVNYNALLYIPSHAPYDYYSKEYEKGLQLYTNGVLIMDKCSELLPDYFSFVRGVIDTEDIPLNISRETLQDDKNIKLIAKSIESKVRNELLDLLKNNRDKYLELYKAFGMQLKFGIYNDYGMHKDKLEDLIMFYSSSEKKLITLDEYVNKLKEEDKNIYYCAGETVDKIDMLPQVEGIKDKHEVLYLTDYVDEFAIMAIHEYKGKTFVNVSNESTDLSTEEEKEKINKENTDNKDMLEEMKKVLEGNVEEVKLTNKLKSHPVCLTTTGEVSTSMEKVINAMPTDEKIKASEVLEINASHKIVDKLKDLYKNNKDEFTKYTKVIYYEARLIEGLPIDNPTELSNLMCDIMANK